MKIKKLIVILGFLLGLAFPKPMESMERYNVILIHGAADSLSGLDCEIADLKEPYKYFIDSLDEFKRTDGYVKESGALWWTDESRSTATGMMKTLPDWINDNVFDGARKDRFGIYLNRPFVNPANTPIVNGSEIGDRTWKGRNNCNVRRSLTEEAEEMRQEGRDSLKNHRSAPDLYRDYYEGIGYRTHRNIFIAHSMGGLASREYVQSDYYNGDVDKVITLDSPHRGTYSLDGLIHIQNAPNLLKHSADALYQKALFYQMVHTRCCKKQLMKKTSQKSCC